MSLLRILSFVVVVVVAVALLAGARPLAASTSNGLSSAAPASVEAMRLAARAEQPRPPDPVEEDPAVPYTVEKARGECWMKLEGDRKAPRELEKRAVLVNKCAEDKMKEKAAH
jgi:hypothetical protein